MTLLSLALLGVGALTILTFMRLDEANTVIDHQNDLIDEKQKFSAAMGTLLSTAEGFEGVRVGALVPQDSFDLLAARAWNDRRELSGMAQVTADVNATTADLEKVLADARAQAAKNSSHSKYESVLDKLGAGFVTTAIDNADKLCQADVLGCVTSEDPYTVHIDKSDTKLPFMTDFIRTGLTYHEFAHVLQYTHPEETDVALDAFKDRKSVV